MERATPYSELRVWSQVKDKPHHHVHVLNERKVLTQHAAQEHSWAEHGQAILCHMCGFSPRGRKSQFSFGSAARMGSGRLRSG